MLAGPVAGSPGTVGTGGGAKTVNFASDSLLVTADWSGARADAVATLSMMPAATSAAVVVYSAEQSNDSPGASGPVGSRRSG